MNLKRVDSVFTKTEANKSDLYNIFGNSMTIYKALPYSDPNFYSYPTSNFWSAIGMFSDINYNIQNKPANNGGILGTSIGNLPSAYMNTGMLVFSIDNNKYRTQLNGHNFAIHIPLDSSYTGMTSGLTATTLYSAFIWDPSCLETTGSICCF